MKHLWIPTTAGEAEAARRVRQARDLQVRGQGDAELKAALADPCIALLLSELADTWDVTPDDDGEDA